MPIKYFTEEERKAAIDAQRKAYYYRNHEKIKEKKRAAARKARTDPATREEFLEKARRARKKWYAKLSPEERRARWRKYSESQKAWRERNKDKLAENAANFRARFRARRDAERRAAGIPLCLRGLRRGAAGALNAGARRTSAVKKLPETQTPATVMPKAVPVKRTIGITSQGRNSASMLKVTPIKRPVPVNPIRNSVSDEAIVSAYLALPADRKREAFMKLSVAQQKLAKQMYVKQYIGSVKRLSGW